MAPVYYAEATYAFLDLVSDNSEDPTLDLDDNALSNHNNPYGYLSITELDLITSPKNLITILHRKGHCLIKHDFIADKRDIRSHHRANHVQFIINSNASI